MQVSSVVIYSIGAVPILRASMKGTFHASFWHCLFSVSSKMKVLWCGWCRKNGSVFSCFVGMLLWFCFLVFRRCWGKPPSTAWIHFQGRRIQPDVQQGKIWIRLLEVIRQCTCMFVYKMSLLQCGQEPHLNGKINVRKVCCNVWNC